MPFPVTVLLDHDAPSETFIRREIALLRQRGWTLHVRYLTHPKGTAGAGAAGGAGTLELQNFRTLELQNFRTLELQNFRTLELQNFRTLELQNFRTSYVALGRFTGMLARSPLDALRLLKRLPQAAALARDLVATDSRLVWAQFAGITADIGAIAAATLNRPWLCSVHAHDVFTPSPKVLAFRLQHAQRVVACSQAAADAVRASGIAPERIEVIHHGVVSGQWSAASGQSGTPIIFSAGRLEPKKGFDVLLRACAVLHARGIPFSCRIAGKGSLDDELRRLAVELGIGAETVFVGWLSPGQVLDEIRTADAVALASRRLPDGDRDGIANVVLEALATGTPVVTTTAGAAAEAIRDNISGRLVPPDDPGALAAALAELLTAPAARQRLAMEGRRVIAESFDPIANIRKLEATLTTCAKIDKTA